MNEVELYGLPCLTVGILLGFWGGWDGHKKYLSSKGEKR
jgi:hypothetical protein